MKRLSLLILPVLLALSGCASVFTNPAPGSTVAEVIALKGQPDAQYQDGNTTLLEWSVPAYGDHAWMARIGPDGKLISYKQVLTRENFGSIRINEFTKNDVLKTVGHPDMKLKCRPCQAMKSGLTVIWKKAYGIR